MLVITPDHVGTVAYARLVRDHAVQPLTTVAALPSDINTHAELKARALAWAVPRRGVVSGTAALWVHGCVPGALPRSIEIAVPRGANPDGPPHTLGYQWSVVTDPVAILAAKSLGGVGVTSPAAACVAALRRDDHTLAIPATFEAISRRLCTARHIDAIVGSHSRRGRGYDRMMSAWREMRALVEPAASAA